MQALNKQGGNMQKFIGKKMINEKQIDDVKIEAYNEAIRKGSRSAFNLIMELYPEQAENIMMQVSVLLEATGHNKLSNGIDKLAKSLK